MYAADVPEPASFPSLERPYNIAVGGVGGTGVLTIGALLGMAAHIEGKASMILDMSGLAQKGGAVLSHVRLSEHTADVTCSRIVTGTGPYTYQSGYGASSETVTWKKNANWWATKQLGIKVAPTYVVDISNSSNAAALASFSAGNIDLFNNFAPKAAIRGQAKTYYSKAPWHLSANTVWLNRTNAALSASPCT